MLKRFLIVTQVLLLSTSSFAKRNYSVTQSGNFLIVDTPYGEKTFVGDSNFKNLSKYYIEIPLDSFIIETVAAKKPSQDRSTTIQGKKKEIMAPTEYLAIANKLYFEKKFEESLLNINQALSLAPDSPQAWAMKGSVFYVMGNKELAEKFWNKSLEIDPTNKLIRDQLSRLY